MEKRQGNNSYLILTSWCLGEDACDAGGSLLDVVIATGFTSHSYFAQGYRLQFGRPPSAERRTMY
jgi:AraC-like DNA-binding protein